MAAPCPVAAGWLPHPGHPVMRQVLRAAGVAGLLLVPANPAAGSFFLGTPLDWQRLDPPARTFLCVAPPAPDWCAEADDAPARRPEPAVTEPDWRALLATLPTTPPDLDSLRQVERRAFADADGSAFEILGYVFATGYGVQPDQRRAYAAYGLAYLYGVAQARADLDAVWPFLSVDEQRHLKQRFEAAFPAAEE